MSIHHTDQLDWAPKKSKDIQSLQKFQKNIASSLLQYTEDKDESRTNSKLVSALLFMLHINDLVLNWIRSTKHHIPWITYIKSTSTSCVCLYWEKISISILYISTCACLGSHSIMC